MIWPTYPTFSCPVIRRCTSSTFKAEGRHRTTTPFSIWLDASLSLPRRTIISFSRLQNYQQRTESTEQYNQPNFEQCCTVPSGDASENIKTWHLGGLGHGLSSSSCLKDSRGASNQGVTRNCSLRERLQDTSG
jgi:hypothetical protein